MNDAIPALAGATVDVTIAPEHTASAMGSGNVDVLATPMLIALMERAARDAVQPYLDHGQITVGTRVEVEHLRPTPVGVVVNATARLTQRQGRLLTFSVSAADPGGEIGRGTHVRMIVDQLRFLAKVRG
jgi:fluoroacetyl-CoA thioesterase